jgi:hypothetical protein
VALLVPLLIGGLIGLLVAGLIGGVILRAALWWVEKIDAPFGDAFVTVFLATLINLGIYLVISVALAMTSSSKYVDNFASLAMTPIGFLILSHFVSSRFQIPFNRGLVVTLAMYAVSLVMGVSIAALVLTILYVFTLTGIVT